MVCGAKASLIWEMMSGCYGVVVVVLWFCGVVMIVLWCCKGSVMVLWCCNGVVRAV